MLSKHFFFFFSSRRRHTRCSRDWSSDVCSSDLKPGLRGELDGLRYDLRGVSETILEIGADRQVGRRDDGGHVGHGFVTTNGAVGLPDGEGITSTGGGQRLKAQTSQQPRRADVPWIRNDECANLSVKGMTGCTLFGLRQHVRPYGAAGSAAGTPKV